MATFYLFETHVPFVFKYGYTSRSLNERMQDYNGIGKPKQIIGHINILKKNGPITEKYFNEFLLNKNIMKISKFGYEYFQYFGNSTDLFNEFRNMERITDIERVTKRKVTSKKRITKKRTTKKRTTKKKITKTNVKSKKRTTKKKNVTLNEIEIETLKEILYK